MAIFPHEAAIRRLFRLGAWGCVALLAVLSLLPAEEMVRTGMGGRIEHVIAYAGTALLAGLGFGRRALPRLAAALVAYAGLLEILQHLSPGRRAAPADWAASSVGVLAGVAAFWLLSLFGSRLGARLRRGPSAAREDAATR